VHGLSFSDVALQQLPVQCPGLTAISLRSCSFNDGVMGLVMGRLKQLEFLGLLEHTFIDWVEEHDSMVQLVQQCPQLSALSVEASVYDDEQLFLALAQLPNLCRLSVADRDCTEFPHSYGHVPTAEEMTTFIRSVLLLSPRLRCLNVAGNTDGNDKWIFTLISEYRKGCDGASPDIAVSSAQCGNSYSGSEVAYVLYAALEDKPQEIPLSAMHTGARFRVCDHALSLL